MTTSLTHQWTIDTVDALEPVLPPGSRVEIIEGSLHVTPAPGVKHQRVLDRIASALTSWTGAWAVMQGLAVGDPADYLIPDLIVTSAEDGVRLEKDEARIVPASMVLLAVEVVSPSSRVHDTRTKPAIYRALDIDAWIIDPAKEEFIVVLPEGLNITGGPQTVTKALGDVRVTLDLGVIYG